MLQRKGSSNSSRRIPSANAAKKTSGASPPKAMQSTMLFLQISLSLQHLDLIWGQSSSEIRENWKLWKKQCNYYLVWSGKAPSINPSNSQARDWWRWPLSVKNLQLYWSWRRRCKRLACSYWYKDEKVLHRRSNVNEIVPAGGTHFSTQTLDDFSWVIKEPWRGAAIIVYGLLSSAIDRPWDEHEQTTKAAS